VSAGNISPRSHSVRVARSVDGLEMAVNWPSVRSWIPPENRDFSRLEPLARPRMRPCSLEKRETVWLVSEKSQCRMQTAWSENLGMGDRVGNGRAWVRFRLIARWNGSDGVLFFCDYGKVADIT